MILYIETFCHYCDRVRASAMKLGVDLEERNIAKIEYLDELIKKGGKRQVPFLIDDEKGISMYESDDIIKYLEEKSQR